MKSNIHEKNIPDWINKSQDFLDDFISLYEKDEERFYNDIFQMVYR